MKLRLFPSRSMECPPNLSKSKVIEIIQKLNASGEVLIPIFIFKDEIIPRLTKNEMIRLHLDIDRWRYNVSILRLGDNSTWKHFYKQRFAGRSVQRL